MMRKPIAVMFAVALCTSGMAQESKRLPEVKPNLHGWLLLPIPVGVPIFNDVTETVGQLDLRFQMPLSKKGYGLGAGVKASLFDLEENSLAPENIAGDVERWTFYGQAQYERYTGPRTYYQLAAQFGTSQYTWSCATCAEPTRQQGFFWGLNASYYLHATDNLAFGVMVGYEQDAARMTPQQLCLDGYPGRTDNGPSAHYGYLTAGLGFSTRFMRSPDAGPGW
ncbi:MAG: hypothetical protein JNL05_15565 [Flavobacteriales bacterium]|nr:hypothetical protein [Flavobacteriales bacterium]